METNKKATYIVVLDGLPLAPDAPTEIITTDEGNVPHAAFLAAARHGYNGPAVVYGPEGIEEGWVTTDTYAMAEDIDL